MKKLGDAAVALTVVACSLVLLGALTFALQGNPFSKSTRSLRTYFTDITGIQQAALVKYGGAEAGEVKSIRILSSEERLKSGHPDHAVEAVLALNEHVPAFNEGLVASVSADTLLSDKFVLLSGGDPAAPQLADGAVIPSIPPVTFDVVLRQINTTLGAINGVLGDGDTKDALSRINALLGDLNETVAEARALIAGGDTLIGDARGLVKNGNVLVDEAGHLVADGRSLIGETREPVKQLIADLSRASDLLEDLAARADRILRENEDAINGSLSDAREALADLKVAAAQGRELIDSLKARPQQLIWGPGRQKKKDGDER